jgi:hypothetical protein
MSAVRADVERTAIRLSQVLICRVTGEVAASTHFGGKRVYQDLTI